MESKKCFGVSEVTTTNHSFFDGGISSTGHTGLDLPNMRRQSRSSLRSEFRSRASASCVNRQASGEDCARQKFIVWAAIKRNSSVRMPPSERLKCPLLRCRQRFYDHEMLLRHVAHCQHLSSGEYMCYDCNRTEVFTEGCKCCLGHPTKRRRIINMAKSFFSGLGHKSRKEVPTFSIGQDEFFVPPPSYHSLEMEQRDEAHIDLEMDGTGILEMVGSMPPVQLDPVNYDHELNSTAQSTTTGIRMTPVFPMPQQTESIPSPACNRPSLALDTHNLERPRKFARTNYLSPSSSLRSTNSSISPISAGSRACTMASNSIGTTLASPITPFSPTGQDSIALSRENSCKFPRDYPVDSCSRINWDESANRAAKLKSAPAEIDNYIFENLCELPGDNPLSVPRAWDEDPFLFSYNPKENYSWSSSVNTEVNMLFTSGENQAPEAGMKNPQESRGSGIEYLIGTAWDTLQEHITSSVVKTESIEHNCLAERLRAHTAKDIALIGLSGLKRLLNGTDLTDPFDYLCFVHVAYAFSLIIHEDDLKGRCNSFFQQALAYRRFINPEYHALYTQVATAIWKPAHYEDAERGGTVLSRSSSMKGKEPEYRMNSRIPIRSDPLIIVAQNFLDDLEYYLVNSDSMARLTEISKSHLWSTHVSEIRPTPFPNDAFAITVDYIVKVLNQRFPDSHDDLSKRLETIRRRVSIGYVTTVRRLELDLLQAAKNCMPSLNLFDEYIPQIRELCDPIYPQRLHARSKYHILGVSLIESLFQNLSKASQLQEAGLPDFALDISDGQDAMDDFDFFETMENSFGNEPEKQQTLIPVSPIESPMELNLVATGISKEVTMEPEFNSTVEASNPVYPPSTVDPAAVLSTVELTGVPEENSSDNSAGSSRGQNLEADSCCELCGYRPRGDPQWFRGSMAKHKKLQHSDEVRFYKCPFSGCTSMYKNRPDNLRQHQIEKGHFVDSANHGERRPPSKRKKME